MATTLASHLAFVVWGDTVKPGEKEREKIFQIYGGHLPAHNRMHQLKPALKQSLCGNSLFLKVDNGEKRVVQDLVFF